MVEARQNMNHMAATTLRLPMTRGWIVAVAGVRTSKTTQVAEQHEQQDDAPVTPGVRAAAPLQG